MKGSFLILLTEQRWSKEQPHLTLILSLLPLHFVVVISTSPVPLHPDTYMQMHIPASRRDAVQEVELECTAFPEELQIKKSVKSAYTSKFERQNLWPFRATWDKPLLLNHKNMWKRKTFIIHWQGRGRIRNCNKLIISKRSNIIRQIQMRWALFVTYTIIQSIMRSEMCSLHLTHPSVHTWSSGQPTVQRPGSSRGLPVGAGIRTHNLGLPQVSSPTLYPLGHDCLNSDYYY